MLTPELEQLIQFAVEDGEVTDKERSVLMRKAQEAGMDLDEREIRGLLDQLLVLENPFTCPHGRPVIIHFTSYELEKMFKRVM